MDAPSPEPDLDNLTISDLESLLANRRRRQGQRMLRNIAGRAPAAAPASTPLRTPHGLAGPPRPGPVGTTPLPTDLPPAHPTVRLGPPPPEGTRAPAVLPPAPDRFGRPALVSRERLAPSRRPAWLRRPGMQPWVDRGLQWAEVGIVLVLLLVVGEWLFTSYSADTDTSDIMAAGPVVAAQRTPARPRSSVTPLIGSAHLAAPATVVATATPPPKVPSATPAGLAAGGGWVPGAPPLSPTPAPPPPLAPRNTPTPDPDMRLPIRLLIPKIKVDTPVREVELNIEEDQATWEVADYMVGHHMGTANPGDIGNIVIAGHRDIRGKVFYKLDQLRTGDEIFVHTSEAEYRYVVRLIKTIKPTAVEVMDPTEDARLTLITCTPIGVASHRLIVVADLDPTYNIAGENQ